MKVTRNFSDIYKSESDPWNIGKADNERYNLYYSLIKERMKPHYKSILDIGCGFGAFLSRFKDDFSELAGVEVSGEAIEKGKGKYPHIKFYQGSADNLPVGLGSAEKYDVVLFSDVIYYLDETGKRKSLCWIADHLAKDGMAFVAAWCPGKQYLKYKELRRLLRNYFRIEHEALLESGHGLFIAEKRKSFVAITVDYETWHPIPAGKKTDWEKDVFSPTESLLSICDAEQAKLTLMAEMGEYFWLLENERETARRMESQWKDAVARGHDVQLHLHPNWLPELGARRNGNDWFWDWEKAGAEDYPGDLAQLIGRCKAALEELLRVVDPSYRVKVFRAGAYRVQPFKRLSEALRKNGIIADSSVFAGGCSAERGYDFSLAYSERQPYYASPYDPQLAAPPAERNIIEIPIFTWRPDSRWFMDGEEGAHVAERLSDFLHRQPGNLSSEYIRKKEHFIIILEILYRNIRNMGLPVNSIFPRKLAHLLAPYAPDDTVGHSYFVMIGHTKADHDFEKLAENFRALRERGMTFVTLSEMAETAKADLAAGLRKNAREEAEYQVRREYRAIMSESHNEETAAELQKSIPMDRTSALDLGCGAGYWSHRIANLYPWMRVTGVDFGFDFIKKADEKFRSETVSFAVADFCALPFDDGTFECVYADNTLEHAYDVDGVLQEVFRVLKWGGALIAGIPSDARNPQRICDNHIWKTAPHEVKLRLHNAGFLNIEIEEIDTYRSLGISPYPPSDDRMMYIKAWKRPQPASPINRLLELMDWVYHRLNPEKAQESMDYRDILLHGYAFCAGYTLVLFELLKIEGFSVRWLTMLAEDHPRGRGENNLDSHEVLLVNIGREEIIIDPMSNTLISHPLEEVLKNPDLAVEKKCPDARYSERGYNMYDTSFWYSRVVKYAVRTDYRKCVRLFTKNKYRRHEK